MGFQGFCSVGKQSHQATAIERDTLCTPPRWENGHRTLEMYAGSRYPAPDGWMVPYGQDIPFTNWSEGNTHFVEFVDVLFCHEFHETGVEEFSYAHADRHSHDNLHYCSEPVRPDGAGSEIEGP